MVYQVDFHLHPPPPTLNLFLSRPLEQSHHACHARRIRHLILGMIPAQPGDELIPTRRAGLWGILMDALSTDPKLLILFFFFFFFYCHLFRPLGAEQPPLLVRGGRVASLVRTTAEAADGCREIDFCCRRRRGPDVGFGGKLVVVVIAGEYLRHGHCLGF